MTNSRINQVLVGLLSLGLLTAAAGSLRAGEHPEHPTKAKAERVKKSSVKMKDVAKAIKQHVKGETRKGGFTVEDNEAGTTLTLKLVKIHKDKLARIAPDKYFACADLKTPEGKVYDLDFFLEGTDKNNLKVTEITVHKEKGKPRYNWQLDKKSGLWEKIAVGTAAKKEHPEHPKKKKPEHPEHPK